MSAMQQRVSQSQRLKTKNFNSLDSEEDETSMSYTPPKSVKSPHPHHSHTRHPGLRSSPLAREGSVLSDSGYALGYASDSSNEGGKDFKSGAVKYNRAFA